jgi:hypothetical protein
MKMARSCGSFWDLLVHYAGGVAGISSSDEVPTSQQFCSVISTAVPKRHQHSSVEATSAQQRQSRKQQRQQQQ